MTIVWSTSLTTVTGNFSTNNVRFSLLAANLLPAGSEWLTVSFTSAAGTNGQIDSAWVGRASSDGVGAYNYFGDQVQLKFGGSNSVPLIGATTVTSDGANCAISAAHDIVVSFHLSGTSVIFLYSDLAGNNSYYSSGVDESSSTAPIQSYITSANRDYGVASIVSLSVDSYPGQRFRHGVTAPWGPLASFRTRPFVGSLSTGPITPSLVARGSAAGLTMAAAAGAWKATARTSSDGRARAGSVYGMAFLALSRAAAAGRLGGFSGKMPIFGRGAASATALSRPLGVAPLAGKARAGARASVSAAILGIKLVAIGKVAGAARARAIYGASVYALGMAAATGRILKNITRYIPVLGMASGSALAAPRGNVALPARAAASSQAGLGKYFGTAAFFTRAFSAASVLSVDGLTDRSGNSIRNRYGGGIRTAITSTGQGSVALTGVTSLSTSSVVAGSGRTGLFSFFSNVVALFARSYGKGSGRAAPSGTLHLSARSSGAGKTLAGLAGAIAFAVRSFSAGRARASSSPSVLMVARGAVLGYGRNAVLAIPAVLALVARGAARGVATVSTTLTAAVAGRGRAGVRASAGAIGAAAISARGRASATGLPVFAGAFAAKARGSASAFASAGVRGIAAAYALTARASGAARGRVAGVLKANLSSVSAARLRGTLAFRKLLATVESRLGRRMFASVTGTYMPQGPDFSQMDLGETITGAIDFANWLAPGDAIASILSVSVTNYPSSGGTALVTLVGVPAVGTVPTIIGGSGIANAAVLQQWSGAAIGAYRITVTITTSSGQTLIGWAHGVVGVPQ